MQTLFKNVFSHVENEVWKCPAPLENLLNSSNIVIDQLADIFDEKIITEVIYQDECTVLKMHWPDVESNEPILFRNVILKGETTNNTYVYANSLIRLNNLNQEVNEDLKHAKLGIGEIIKSRKLNTSREITEIQAVDRRMVSGIFDVKSNIISRKYKIHINDKPTILITEYYPVDLFKSN